MNLKEKKTYVWLPKMCSPLPVAVSLALSLAVVGFGALFFDPKSVNDLPVFLILSLWQVLTSIAFVCWTENFWRRFTSLIGAPFLAVILFLINWSLGYMFLEVCRGFGLSEISDSFSLSLRETLLVVFTVMSGMWTAYLHGEAVEKTQMAARAQIDAIQSRMNPHFLFNTINGIVGMIRTRPADAEEATLCLADLLRASLTDYQSSHTLGQEMDLVEKYLFIEKTRLGERLETKISPTPTNRAHVLIPRLLLQPIVENAIIHGIAKRQQGGLLTIEWTDKPDGISLRVLNPSGPDSSVEPSKGFGVGLSSLEKRALFFFGLGAKISATNMGGVFCVDIFLPIKTPNKSA